MRCQLSFLASLFLLLFAPTLSAQSTPSIQTFFAASYYDDYEGEARIALIRQLEKDGWYKVDSIYEWNDKPGKTSPRTIKIDLAPFINEPGEVVYFVTDVAVQFPRGRKALQQYMRDVLGPVVSGPDDEVQNTVYIRCTIGTDGSINDVAEAQSHAEWIPAETLAKCLDAVRYMPNWSSGVFKGKPVQTCVLVTVALRE